MSFNFSVRHHRKLDELDCGVCDVHKIISEMTNRIIIFKNILRKMLRELMHDFPTFTKAKQGSKYIF